MNILSSIVKDVSKDFVEVCVDASNWRDAVIASGTLLLKGGKVTPDYVQAMINTTKKLGPYAVIAPGIAVPHARPEEGALKLGLAIIILKKPVDFDSPNDPVRVVIGFSAPTHEEHIQLLKELALLLTNDEFRRRLRKCQKKENVIQLLRMTVGVEP